MEWAKVRHFKDLEKRFPDGYIKIPLKVKTAISDYNRNKISLVDLNGLWDKERDNARDAFSVLDLDPDRFIPDVIVSSKGKGQGDPKTWKKRFNDALSRGEYL